MSSVTSIYHFHNSKVGGVYSVIKTLVQYQQGSEIENHLISIKNTSTELDFQMSEWDGLSSHKVFLYNLTDNFYHICQRLSKLVPENAVIVAHDSLELGMVSNLGLQNKVVFFLHGDYDYYYELAVRHSDSIDDFICVALSIQKKLAKLLPDRINDIHYLRVPVPDLGVEKNENSKIKIAFVGRGEHSKGFDFLPEIANCFIEKKIGVEWDIFGEIDADCSGLVWPENCKISFHGHLPNNILLEKLKTSDYIILPSNAEGMPLAIVEAMKMGVIPLVNNIKGGIQEIIKNGETGFLINNNCILDYVNNIIEVESNYALKRELQKNVVNLANKFFDPRECTKNIETVFLKKTLKIKPAFKIYCSRLDQKWIPNIFTRFVRNFIYGS